MNSTAMTKREPAGLSLYTVRLAARASLHSSVAALLLVFQSAAFAQMWSWIAHPMRLPRFDIWLAIGLGALLAMIKAILFKDRGFSWPWVCGVLARTVVLLMCAYLASLYMRHGNPFAGLDALKSLPPGR